MAVTTTALTPIQIRARYLSSNARIRVLLFITVGLAGAVITGPLLCQSGGAGAHLSVAELTKRGENELEKGRTMLEEQTLTGAGGFFEECIRMDGRNARCYFDLALTESYLVRVKDAQHDRQSAERQLEAAILNVQSSIRFNDHSADAHALLADLYGSKIGFDGGFAAMRYGPKANDEIQRAFQLDANNPRALGVIGRKYLYSPKIFGGDIDRAIDSFRKATEFDPHNDEAYVWLAIAYRKKGDTVRAQSAVREALQLNGQSAFAKRIASGAAD